MFQNNNLSTLKSVETLPPFLLQVVKCNRWSEIVEEILPDVNYMPGSRMTNLPLVFNDPVVCRLYDALYAEVRHDYALSLASEYWGFIDILNNGTTVVEVGCGPGTVLLHLAKMAKEKGKEINFVGWDISSEMIYLAERRRAAYKLDNVTFLLGISSDKQCLDYLKNAQLLLSRNVLSWVEDPNMEIALWKQTMPKDANIISREVRRDISFEQFKNRMLEACQFTFAGQLLAYPLAAYLISYLRAFTGNEHLALFRRHFPDAQALTVGTGLKSDLGKAEEAESQLICIKR